MSCLALSLQPTNGSDILLQTREWFPPARALDALSAFRQTRRAFATNKHSIPDDAYTAESIGDDPLVASRGQVIVGVESRYRIVYRLVNGIYVLGITVADHDNSINVFECIHIVNQAVSVAITARHDVDVTLEKLSRKYAKIYMALDIVLRDVNSIRLAAMLATMHGESIAKMVHSVIDTENKIRSVETWPTVEIHSLEHQASIHAFSNATFKLPSETLEAGDEVATSLAPRHLPCSCTNLSGNLFFPFVIFFVISHTIFATKINIIVKFYAPSFKLVSFSITTHSEFWWVWTSLTDRSFIRSVIDERCWRISRLAISCVASFKFINFCSAVQCESLHFR